jgi:hypothetical protein
MMCFPVIPATLQDTGYGEIFPVQNYSTDRLTEVKGTLERDGPWTSSAVNATGKDISAKIEADIHAALLQNSGSIFQRPSCPEATELDGLVEKYFSVFSQGEGNRSYLQARFRYISSISYHCKWGCAQTFCRSISELFEVLFHSETKATFVGIHEFFNARQVIKSFMINALILADDLIDFPQIIPLDKSRIFVMKVVYCRPDGRDHFTDRLISLAGDA